MSTFFATLALKKYFEVFFKNSEQINFDLSFMKGETCLQNVEINEKVIQEIMEFPNLEVKRVFVSEIKIKMSLTKLKSEPIVISIDNADVFLEEPEIMSPPPSILGALFPKQNEGNSNSPKLAQNKEYGLIHKIADSFRLEVKKIRVILKLRPDKTIPNQPKTRPTLVMEMEKVCLKTTDYRWQACDLKRIRDFNKNREYMYVFRELSCEKAHFTLHSTEYNLATDLLKDLPLLIHITLKKRQSTLEVVGIQVDIEIQAIKLELDILKCKQVFNFLEGILMCIGRVPKQLRINPKPYTQSLLVNILVHLLSVKLITSSNHLEAKRILELNGNELDVGLCLQLRNDPSLMKIIQVSLAGLCIVEHQVAPIMMGQKSSFIAQRAPRVLLQNKASDEQQHPSSLMDMAPSRTVYPAVTVTKVPSDQATPSSTPVLRPPVKQTPGQPNQPPSRASEANLAKKRMVQMSPLLCFQFTSRGVSQPKIPDKELYGLINPIEMYLHKDFVESLFIIIPDILSELTKHETAKNDESEGVPNFLLDQIRVNIKVVQLGVVLPLPDFPESTLQILLNQLSLWSDPLLERGKAPSKGLATYEASLFPNQPTDMDYFQHKFICDAKQQFKFSGRLEVLNAPTYAQTKNVQSSNWVVLEIPLFDIFIELFMHKINDNQSDQEKKLGVDYRMSRIDMTTFIQSIEIELNREKYIYLFRTICDWYPSIKNHLKPAETPTNNLLLLPPAEAVVASPPKKSLDFACSISLDKFRTTIRSSEGGVDSEKNMVVELQITGVEALYLDNHEEKVIKGLVDRMRLYSPQNSVYNISKSQDTLIPAVRVRFNAKNDDSIPNLKVLVSGLVPVVNFRIMKTFFNFLLPPVEWRKSLGILLNASSRSLAMTQSNRDIPNQPAAKPKSSLVNIDVLLEQCKFIVITPNPNEEESIKSYLASVSVLSPLYVNEDVTKATDFVLETFAEKIEISETLFDKEKQKITALMQGLTSKIVHPVEHCWCQPFDINFNMEREMGGEWINEFSLMSKELKLAVHKNQSLVLNSIVKMFPTNDFVNLASQFGLASSAPQEIEQPNEDIRKKLKEMRTEKATLEEFILQLKDITLTHIDLLDVFIDKADEHLQTAESQFKKLKQMNDDTTLLNEFLVVPHADTKVADKKKQPKTHMMKEGFVILTNNKYKRERLYVVMESFVLKYSKDAKSPKLGEVQIGPKSSVDVCDGGFQITYENETTIFMAESENDMVEWVNVILHVQGLAAVEEEVEQNIQTKAFDPEYLSKSYIYEASQVLNDMKSAIQRLRNEIDAKILEKKSTVELAEDTKAQALTDENERLKTRIQELEKQIHDLKSPKSELNRSGFHSFSDQPSQLPPPLPPKPAYLTQSMEFDPRKSLPVAPPPQPAQNQGQAQNYQQSHGANLSSSQTLQPQQLQHQQHQQPQQLHQQRPQQQPQVQQSQQQHQQQKQSQQPLQHPQPQQIQRPMSPPIQQKPQPQQCQPQPQPQPQPQQQQQQQQQQQPQRLSPQQQQRPTSPPIQPTQPKQQQAQQTAQPPSSVPQQQPSRLSASVALPTPPPQSNDNNKSISESQQIAAKALPQIPPPLPPKPAGFFDAFTANFTSLLPISTDPKKKEQQPQPPAASTTLATTTASATQATTSSNPSPTATTKTTPSPTPTASPTATTPTTPSPPTPQGVKTETNPTPNTTTATTVTVATPTAATQTTTASPPPQEAKPEISTPAPTTTTTTTATTPATPATPATTTPSPAPSSPPSPPQGTTETTETATTTDANDHPLQ